MDHLKDKTICSTCWATIDIKDTVCSVCNSTVKKDSRSKDDLKEDIVDLADHRDNSSNEQGSKISPVAITAIFFILILVMAVGMTYGKDVVIAESVTVEDYVGEWEVTEVRGLEDLINRSDNGVGMKFNLWKKGRLIESKSPLPGRLDFKAQLDDDLLRGDYTLVYSDSIANPVVAELTRDKKRMTIYFKIDDIGTRIDTIIRLKKSDPGNVKSIFSVTRKHDVITGI